MLNVLQICQKSARRLGIPVPTTVSGAVDAQTIQLGELLQEVMEYLVEHYNWQTNRFTATHSAIAASSQGSIYSLMSASFKRVVPKTMWNLSVRRPISGPVSGPSRQVLAAIIPAGPLDQFWVKEDQLFLLPVPTAGHSISWEWETKDCFLAVDGATRKTLWTEDTDTPLLDDSMIRVGLRAFWRREKGLAYADLLEQFELMAQLRSAGDGVKGEIHLDCPGDDDIRPGLMIPAGSWDL